MHLAGTTGKAAPVVQPQAIWDGEWLQYREIRRACDAGPSRESSVRTIAVRNPWRIRIDSSFPQPVHSMEADVGSCHVYKKVFSLLCEIGVNFM